MKKYLIFILTVIMLLGSLACSEARDEDIATNYYGVMGSENISYQLNTSLPAVPTHLPVYKIIQPKITEGYVQGIGAKFGFSGVPQLHANDEGSFYHMENKETGELLLIFTETGAITFEFKSGAKLFPSDSPALPDNKMAKEIATNYLHERGLLSSDIKIRDEVVAGGTYKEGIPAHLLVRFDYCIGNLPITGPGKKLGVRIGNGGEVIQVMMHHVETETSGATIPIKTAEEAYQDLINNKGKVEQLDTEGRNVQVKKVSLGYWLDPMGTLQEYLYPVYIFDVDYYDKSGNFEYEFIEWVDAPKNS
jgi:hypothetical protein